MLTAAQWNMSYNWHMKNVVWHATLCCRKIFYWNSN